MKPGGKACDFVPGRPHWWQWLTVLSLDAPLVAIAWQSTFSHAGKVSLQWHHVFLLGVAVWLIYVADRWIEGWRLDDSRIRTQRHWFYRRYRRPLAGAWTVAAVAALIVAGGRLTAAEWTTGLLLLVPVAVYLLSHQLLHRDHPWRLPKECCVAVLFAAGVVCMPAANRPASLREAALPLLLFCLLCFANCAAISYWEEDVDRAHGQQSLALQWPGGRRWARVLPWLVAASAAAYGIRPAITRVGPAGWVAASGVLLGLVDLALGRLGRQRARTLADLVLLTPLLEPVVRLVRPA